MNITMTHEQGLPPVTILHLDGRLDGTNYLSLVDAAQTAYADGARDLVLDLSKLAYLSSAGITAIHRVALLFRGETGHEQEDGWAAYRAIDRDRDRGVQAHVKLFGLTEPVRHALDLTGFSVLFEIHTDLRQAAESFREAEMEEVHLP